MLNSRELFQHPNRYLKPGEIIVTKHGNPYLKIVVTDISREVVTSTKPDTRPDIVTSSQFCKKPLKPEDIVGTNEPFHYDQKCPIVGCTFLTAPGNGGLCIKHWRLKKGMEVKGDVVTPLGPGIVPIRNAGHDNIKGGI